MSQLKVNGIRHTGASSDAVTLASDGTCTAKITNNLSNRNKVINGAMAISQRGTSFAAANNAYTLDRFRIAGSHDGAVTVTQSSTSPDGFANSLKIDVTTADTSIAASQYLQLQHKIEAQDLQDLAFGTSAAKTITVSFWVRSNVTGTYTFDIQQPDNSYKHVSQTYTINSADTWEKKTFTFAGDTSGVINNDNGNGLDVYWNVAIGSTYTTGTSRSTWTTYANADFAPGQTVNLLSSTSNEWYVTGVQLEVDSTGSGVATDFEHRSYGDKLNRCLRYYYRMTYSSSAFIGVGTAWNTDSSGGTFSVPVSMRTSPTMTVNAGGDFETTQVFGDTQTCTAVSMPYSSAYPYNVMGWRGVSSGNHDDGEAYILRFKDGQTSGYISLSAEL